MATNGTSENVGKLIEIKGVVVDAVFPARLPEIYSALRITPPDGSDLVAEVQQHLGDDRVRAVALDTTDGLARGTDVVTPARRSRCRSNPRRSDGSGTCSASRSTTRAATRPRSAGRSTATRRTSRTCRRRSRSSRRASRS